MPYAYKINYFSKSITGEGAIYMLVCQALNVKRLVQS